jgi:hypothetical protein
VLEVEDKWIRRNKALLVLFFKVLFISFPFDFSCEKQMLSWGGVQGLSVE